MIKIKKDQILILVTLDIFLMLQQPYSKMDLIISPKILQTIPHI